MIPYSLTSEQLAIELIRAGEIVLSGEYTLASGLKSPVYVGCRGLTSYPRLLRYVGMELALSLRIHCDFDLIAGVPTAGDPLAQAASREALEFSSPLIWPVIRVRDKPKEHGDQAQILGCFNPGNVCMLVDNAITSGETIIKFVQDSLQPADLVAKAAICLVDREQGGRDALWRHGIKLYSVFTLTEVLDFAFKAKLISADRYALIQSYRADPLAYADNAEIKAAQVM